MNRIVVAVAFLLSLAIFAPQAKASPTNFSCGSGTCTGTVVSSETGWYSNGISVLAGPFDVPYVGDGDESGEAFSLSFYSYTNQVRLADADGDALLAGVLMGYSAYGDTLFLGVAWLSPEDFEINPGFVIIHANNIFPPNCPTGCAVTSADIAVLPTPEPSSVFLLGTGLIGIGAAIKKHR